MSVVDVTGASQDDGPMHETAGRRGPRAHALMPKTYVRRKVAVDGLLAAILLVPGLPIIGLLALLVRLTSRGPGLFRQSRVGKDGRTFTMYKLRTMRHDAEAATGAVWAQKDDPRATFVGGVLRKLHLDELPQLFNVLGGEMSLVGPRPERPEFVPKLAEEIPGYLDRLAVRPGITGLAQINLDPDVEVDDVRRKLVLDLEYVASATALLDFRIVLCTVLHLVGINGESARRIVGLARKVTIEDEYTPPLSSVSDLDMVPAGAAIVPDAGVVQGSQDYVVSK